MKVSFELSLEEGRKEGRRTSIHLGDAARATWGPSGRTVCSGAGGRVSSCIWKGWRTVCKEPWKRYPWLFTKQNYFSTYYCLNQFQIRFLNKSEQYETLSQNRKCLLKNNTILWPHSHVKLQIPFYRIINIAFWSPRQFVIIRNLNRKKTNQVSNLGHYSSDLIQSILEFRRLILPICEIRGLALC